MKPESNAVGRLQPPLCIAGIGASAGGLEAVTQLLKAMPADSGIAFVVVQHFDPSSKSMAAEIYARRTEMTVVEAIDGAGLEANHVYTIPSNKEAAIANGRFRLTALPADRQTITGPRLPIDRFLRSLATDQQEKAIAIICSGTGCDGTLGLKAVKEHGGVVLVQQPETAQFDGMPHSAIASGLADYVAIIEQMPEILLGYATHPYIQSGKDFTADAHESAVDSQAALSDSSVVIHDARVKRNGGYVALLKQLEDELQVTKDDLQSSIERLEISNEELKISNEEVVSVNEELQSINKELESSKEELQSLNEELNTVNQQLELKISELETANNCLKHLISSSEIATLCLDRNFCVKWFTPALRIVFSLVATDVGRPISDFSSSISGIDLVKAAKAVLEKLEPQQKELLSEDDRWYLQRILPYRTDHEAIDGVIVTFLDISESKRAADIALAEREKILKSLEQRVEQRTAELRSLAFELTKSEERERRAVALDLHDGLGQTLAIAKIKLCNLHDEQDLQQVLKAIVEVEKLLDEGNQSVRSLSAQLSPAVLYDLGLVPALEWLADEMLRNHGLVCHIEEDGKSKPLDPAVRVILFRAVRELLINVVKHANVNMVRVKISIVAQLGQQRGSSITITITDTGKGFEPSAVTASVDGGFGLLNVRERLAYIGGSAEVVSSPGAGTQVTLTAPMQPA